MNLYMNPDEQKVKCLLCPWFMGCGNKDKFKSGQPAHIIEPLSVVAAAIARDIAFYQLNNAHRSNVPMTSEDWEIYKNHTDIPECHTPQV